MQLPIQIGFGGPPVGRYGGWFGAYMVKICLARACWVCNCRRKLEELVTRKHLGVV